MTWSAPPWRPEDCASSGHSEKDAGVIGETVDPAEFADSLLDHRTDLGPVRNVAFDSQDTAPNLAHGPETGSTDRAVAPA